MSAGLRIVGLLLAIAASSAWPGEGKAALAGTVRFEGDIPAPYRFDLSASPRDVPVCRGESADAFKPSNRLQVHPQSRGVASVVAILSTLDGKTPPGAPPFPAPRSVLVDQVACAYVPFVTWVEAGQPLQIRSSDRTLHNVHAYKDRIGGETLFNVAMPVQGQTIEKKFADPGLVALACDAGHNWMSAYVFVVENPCIAVTPEEGSFKFEGLAPGEYKLTLWQAGWKVTPVGTDPVTKKPRGFAYSEPLILERTVRLKSGANTLEAALTPEGWKEPGETSAVEK
ncbi:MAG: hypothetical protein HS116_04500 [Planctomycetes bacterium]|nr:hypothetical protein [Planctomycetota bacterium]